MIVVAGQINEGNVLKEVNKIFAKVPRGIKAKKLKVKEIQKNQRYWSVSKNRSNAFCFRCS